MSNDFQEADRPRILTNMAFWQSETWCQRVDSIYDLKVLKYDPEFRPALTEVCELLRKRNDYDVVLTMGARESLMYGLLCLLAHRPSRQIMTEVFIDNPHPGNPLWHLKVGLYRLAARRAIGILTNSSAEVVSIAKRFNIGEDRVRFVPLNSDIPEPQMSEKDEGFVLGAGRTLRDYETLIRAAKTFEYPVLIICGKHDLRHTTIPQNVKILRAIPRDKYLQCLSNCSIVALPLRDTLRATGQVVMLEAMAFGKPVITTRSPGTIDYVRHGENGILIEPGDDKALAGEIRRLMDDRKLARSLAERALKDVIDHRNPEAHAEAKLAAIRGLWSTYAATT